MRLEECDPVRAPVGPCTGGRPSIVDCLESWAHAVPDARLFTFLSVDGATRASYTYGEFRARTRDVAAHLADVGLKAGDRALLVYPPGLEIVVALLACARRGVVAVPACPPGAASANEAASKLRFIARDCGAAAVLTTRALLEDSRVASLAPRSTCTDEVPATVRPAADAAHPILLLQYTSGSTRAPKGVMVSHENVVHNARIAIDHVPIGVSWLPQYHDMGLLGYYLFPIVVGGRSYGFAPADFLRRPALWLQTISRVRATYSSSPNFGFDYCLRPGRIAPEEMAGVDLGSLRVLMSAAEPARADTYARFLERFRPYGLRPEASVVAYGLAEHTLAATHYGRRSLHVGVGALSRNEVEETDGTGHGTAVMSCGSPLDGVRLRVVDPDTGRVLPERRVGEIWLGGPSVTAGYWNRPDLTRQVYCNTPAGEAGGTRYLRTGDLGFLDAGELFVCGRLKDLIISRGVNHHPQDIEAAVERACPQVLAGGVVAFSGRGEDEPLVVMVETRKRRNAPDPAGVAVAVRRHCAIEPDVVVIVPPHTIVRTTSGKIARSHTRDRFLASDFVCLAIHTRAAGAPAGQPESTLRRRFSYVFALDPSGGGTHSLAELGIDSLTLVQLVMDLEQLLEERDASDVVGAIDAELLQRLTITEFAALLESLESGRHEGTAHVVAELRRLRREGERDVARRMRQDATLRAEDLGRPDRPPEAVTSVLLTGATGFFGPFLLERLLARTPFTYFVLTRAATREHGMERIRRAMRRSKLWTDSLARAMETRVRVVCGDLARPMLGLDTGEWRSLACSTQAVCHNAALVNYVLNYDVLKPHNVDGTRTLLRLATTGTPKQFHFVSSTFIFGWTVKGLLLETDDNEEMAGLDFGYSQTKWVADQLVQQAGRRGVETWVYRPSLISASRGGVGDDGDVAVRLLAFMINHGIAVDTANQVSMVPADVAAENIAALFAAPPPTSRTLHVTAEHYYSMPDLTGAITRGHGYQFEYFDIPGFLEQLNRRCTKDDPLYPLLDFFNRSASKIAAMRLKRYGNGEYQQARRRSGARLPDPGPDEIAEYLVRYLRTRHLVAHAAGSADRPTRP